MLNVVWSSKAQHVTSRPIRAVIIQHVAFGAIPSGVPITALPSCFSFSCRWHILSVAESACFVSTFQLVTLVATCLAQFPLFLKPCVRYAFRSSSCGWISWTCRGTDGACAREFVLLGLPFGACAQELVLLGLPFTKSQVFQCFLLGALPILCATCYAIPRSVPITSFPSLSSKLSSRHVPNAPESSNGVPTVPISTFVATNSTSTPFLLKARIDYLHRPRWCCAA